jgi:glutamine amidotransferase
MVAYVGPPLAPARLIYDVPHGLEQQACAPKEMVSGTVNVDGTGLAWWNGDETEPLRYVTTAPPWSDPNLPHLTRRISGRAILAAVRSATPGIPSGAAGVAPFVDADLAVTHNGYMKGFEGPIGRRLIEGLSDDLHARLEIRSDSLALFLLMVARRRERTEQPLDELLAGVCSEAAALAHAEGRTASLNFLACDGRRIAATRCAVGVPSNSLYLQRGGAAWADDSVLLASEPLDGDGGWQAVPDGHRVLADGTMLEIASL